MEIRDAKDNQLEQGFYRDNQTQEIYYVYAQGEKWIAKSSDGDKRKLDLQEGFFLVRISNSELKERINAIEQELFFLKTDSKNLGNGTN